MKYLECLASQQDKEAMMMEKVLFTALKVQENELKKVAEARMAAVNSGLMSYFWAPENLVAKPMKPRAVNPHERVNNRYQI
jgi:hypothetical protein